MDMSTLGAALSIMKKNTPTINPEDIAEAVDDYLDDHPEATTTVQDGSITKAKLDNNLQGTVDDVDDLKSALNDKQDAPETAGTAGQVLGLDSNGNPEWQDVSLDPQDIAEAVSDWCNENITEDPTVVIDKSLLINGAAADSEAVGIFRADVNDRMADSRVSDAEDVDLDIADEDGNVIVRFTDGHLKTKNFDSADVIDAISGDIAKIRNTDADQSCFDVADNHGKVIARFKNGEFQTQKFNSGTAVLKATGDTTDRAAEINAILSSAGMCQLGKGVFYVSGIVMPDSSVLSGCGASTKIVLLDSVTNGAAIKMKSYCIVKDLQVGNDTSFTPSSTSTNRVGIIRVNDNNSHYVFGKISNVSIVGISQGIVAQDNTTADRTGLLVENVNIYLCDIGLSIMKCEYNRFSNMIIASCYYGVLNNAGNNLFSNCTFISCTESFVMDDVNVSNNGHGSAIGCQFNHSGENNGIAVRANKMTNGFVFSGCQFFSSKVSVTNSEGIAIHGCNFGGTSGQTGYLFEVTNNDGADRVMMIDNSIFSNNPVINKSNTSGTTTVIVSNCYTRNGNSVTIS